VALVTRSGLGLEPECRALEAAAAVAGPALWRAGGGLESGATWSVGSDGGRTALAGRGLHVPGPPAAARAAAQEPDPPGTQQGAAMAAAPARAGRAAGGGACGSGCVCSGWVGRGCAARAVVGLAVAWSAHEAALLTFDHGHAARRQRQGACGAAGGEARGGGGDPASAAPAAAVGSKRTAGAAGLGASCAAGSAPPLAGSAPCRPCECTCGCGPSASPLWAAALAVLAGAPQPPGAEPPPHEPLAEELPASLAGQGEATVAEGSVPDSAAAAPPSRPPGARVVVAWHAEAALAALLAAGLDEAGGEGVGSCVVWEDPRLAAWLLAGGEAGPEVRG
jgi:hypothetical protein